MTNHAIDWGVEVDGLWSHSKGDPCVHWVTRSRSEWKMVNGQLWQPAPLGAQWVGWRQTGPAQCSRQLAGWYNSLSLEWICNRPSFRAHRCRCVCFARHNHPLYTHMEAEQMESYWKFSSSSCLMLIRWHRWVDITKTSWGGMQLPRHNSVWSYNTFNLWYEANTSGFLTSPGTAASLIRCDRKLAQHNNVAKKCVRVCVPHRGRAVWWD